MSECLRRVPGVLAFVGTRNPQIGATYAQHSCFYKIDETVLAKGSMVAAQYAIDFLAEPTQEELDGPTIAAVAETNPDLAAKLPHVDNINMNRITPDFVQHLDSGTRAIITSAYSDALVPIFLYVVPLLVVGFVLMLTLKEHPLATKVNHTGHPGDTV